ncbi:2-polyprenyl-6-methoxyphenol hydroxylase-like FAD-dependent oxidoreductase [Actinoalloteichus hoggarensis]|uniref:FAD-dependent urate hydroxylase n=1 Tax=Actinoalloteichus hoggarensis TaxID=1470176 RepID=A0A221VXS1_9PSEU|nr:FAD-dependent monooxygenase [Actinoalloteichus hoggarensis]ASO18349.1 FAD-dependent urate hydroxylase [Actinoalloteichus hoggarensis]MBB5921712.1 2-polyprenyl-6-methoxyphenol hydroxylase-like FAD-dependent oxidoreductase [Actinoalloteichus hoggarensis]
MTNASATTALIIGGGIAGPVTAAALARVGVAPIVHEAYAGPADQLGAFLTVAPNGLAALRAVGMLDRVRAAASFDTTRTEFVNGDGRRLGLLGDESRLPPELRSVTITRAALQRAVTDAAIEQGVDFEYAKRLRSYTDEGNQVTATFTDGTSATGDVLLGADGIQSAVRRTLSPDAPRPTYTGLLGIGGYVPAVDIPPTPHETVRMVFGARAFFGYQRAPDGRTFWFANLGHSERSREEIAAQGDETWRDHALELFDGDLPELTRIMEAADPGQFRPRGTYDLLSLPRWHRGRVGLLGDAAHAVSPSSGQGASLAFEDAVELARQVRVHGGAPAALAAYERVRRDRVERIAAEGRRRGARKAGSAHPIALAIRDASMRLAFAMIRRFGSQRWITDYRTDLADTHDDAEASSSIPGSRP